MKSLLKTLLSVALFTSIALVTHANTAEHQPAEHPKDVVEVSSEAQSLKEDLAYTQVFSEICPQLIGQNKNFEQAYKNVIQAKLTGVPNPDVAMKFLNQDDEEYQALLQHFRKDIASASSEDNRTVCLDMIDWDKKK